MRHDWIWPSSSEQTWWSLTYSTSAWLPGGLGSPNLYLGGYLFGVAIAALNLTLSPFVGLIAYLAICAVAIVNGVGTVARTLGASRPATFCAQIIALFNPWTYNEVVAGHTFLLLSLAAIFFATRAFLRQESSDKYGLLAVILAAPQLQIFIIVLVFCLVLFIRDKSWVPLTAGILLALPEATSLGSAFDEVALIPITQAWQSVQSANFTDAIALGGYASNYAARLGWQARWAVDFIAASGIGSLLLSSASQRLLPLVALSVSGAAVLISTGTKGLLQVPYLFLVDHFKPIGIFRELYDLLLFALFGYLILFLVASWQRYPTLQIAIGSIVAAVLSFTWLTHPPSEFFLDRERIPTTHITLPAGSRFALFPALQPLSFDGGGSGADPDAYGRTNQITPLNEYVSAYPEIAALCGGSGRLSRLGVSVVIYRPWLTEAEDKACATRSNSTHNLVAGPILASEDRAEIVSLASHFGSGAVFWPDAQPQNAHSTIVTIVAPNVSANAAQAWVDARLMFSAYPQTAQPYGGWTTTNRMAELPLSGDARYVLAYVDGRLFDASTRLRSIPKAYSWIDLPHRNKHRLRCEGVCTVAVATKVAPFLPLEAPRQRLKPIQYVQVSPWLIRAECACAETVVFYNERFARGWQAWDGFSLLSHFRIDGYANGWRLEETKRDHKLTIVYLPGVAVLLLEIAGGLTVLTLMMKALLVPRIVPVPNLD